MRNPFRQTFGLQGLARSARAATALPQQASLVTWLDSDDATGADGAAVASWVDRINGITAVQATGGLQPVTKTGMLGGHRAMRFAGQVPYMTIPTPGAMKTAIDSQNYTILIVAKKVSAGANGGVLFGAGVNTNGLLYFLDGTNVGRYNQGMLPYSGTDLVVQGSAHSNAWSGIASNAVYEQVYVQGMSVATIAGTAIAGGANTFTIGATSAAALKANADIYAILVWNRTLTPKEYLQATKWAFDRYAQPYPWASASRILAFDGDSITSGYRSSLPQYAMPYRVATALGLPFGTWCNLGVGGMHAQNMDAIAASRVDHLTGDTGKPVLIAAMCWANAAVQTPGQGRTPAQIYGDLTTYLTNRRAVSPQVKTLLSTSTDLDTGIYPTPGGTRADFNALWDTYWSGSHPLLDGYAATHLNTSIGTVGALAANPSLFNADKIHPVDNGYAQLASVYQTAISAVP